MSLTEINTRVHNHPSFSLLDCIIVPLFSKQSQTKPVVNPCWLLDCDGQAIGARTHVEMAKKWPQPLPIKVLLYNFFKTLNTGQLIDTQLYNTCHDPLSLIRRERERCKGLLFFFFSPLQPRLPILNVLQISFD